MVIVAPTAQGKTEAFILPVLKHLVAGLGPHLVGPGIRALLIYPTKALARDQLTKISEMCAACGLRADVFDGDTPKKKREEIYRSPPEVLITNPDVLHYHMGWDRSRLEPLLHTVRFVVLDEIHLYTGSFGANVYYILKRLAMLCGSPQMIGASATIANPKEFAELMFDTEVQLVESKQARRGPIHFMMFYPGTASKYLMITRIVEQLYRAGHKILVFGNTHSEAETLNAMLTRRHVKSKVHRAGLPRKYRTEVEKAFREGDLRVIVSTPTLELGIDIGDLDCVVSMLVSVTRLTQRVGRAGRKGQESMAFLALRDKDPISSFYRHNPAKYFTDVDAAYMEPGNEVVARYQLMAAARSGMLTTEFFPRQMDVLNGLVQEGILRVTGKGRVTVNDWSRLRSEFNAYSIRGIGDTVEIKEGDRKIGERTMPMAAQELHPGAIYMHGGKRYLSLEFSYVPGMGRARVREVPASDVHTRPLYFMTPRIDAVHESRRVFGTEVHYCSLTVTQQVEGYVEVNTLSSKVVALRSLDVPLEYSFKTRGLVFRAPEPARAVTDYLDGRLDDAGGPVLSPEKLFIGTFHALEHVLLESSAMFTGGGSNEAGGVSMGDSGFIFVYDAAPGGNGASKLLYGRLEEAFSRAERILAQCDCKRVDGCPLCTYSYRCGNNNQPLFKHGALDSLRQILEGVEVRTDVTQYSGHKPVV